MASVNRVILVGNLGRDPEIRFTQSGEAVANFSIACTERYKGKDGTPHEVTEWVRISLFGKQAEVAEKYLKKGASVYIEGRLQTRKWTDKDGAEHQTTEVRGDRMQMLGGRDDASPGAAAPRAVAPRSENVPAQPKAIQAQDPFGDMEDDIPFE